MSSVMTDPFKAAWRNMSGRRPVTLAKIELVSPSTQTLYVASTEIYTPGGQLWESGLKAGGSIRATVDFLGTGPNPCDATIAIANRQYAFQGSGTIATSLHSFQWQGATVTLYFWEQSLTSFADALQVMQGTIDSYDLDDSWLTLNLLQPRTWNKPCPSMVVDKSTYPNAPDSAQGMVLPIIYGDNGALPMRTPHTSAYGTNQQRREEAGAGSGTLPFLLVDPGTGSANVKVVVAGHPCMTINDRASGHSSFYSAGDVLAPLDPTGTSVVAGADGSAQLSINDDTMVAYFGVLPIDVRAANNTALNPRRAMDPFDETTFATLNQTAGQNVLELQLPNPSPMGYVLALDVNVCFIGNAANTQNIRVYPYNPVAAVAGTVVAQVSTTATPVMLAGTWDNAWGNQSWQFGGMNLVAPDRTTIDLRIDFAGAVANNKASILWASVRVKFKPQRNLAIPGSVAVAGTKVVFGWQKRLNLPSDNKVAIADQYNVLFDFFGNVKGYADDGGGTYTGTAASLIELPPDIAYHFLATYGLQTQFETAAGAFGSFATARWKVKNGASSQFKLAGRVGAQTTVQQILQSICEQSLSACIYDRFTSKWLFSVWRPGDVPDYDWLFDRTDCPDLFDTGVTSDVNLRQGVRVQYAYDHFKGRTQFEAFSTAVGSSQGYTNPTWRDQANIVITAANKYLDVTLGATVAATVALGTYTSPSAMIQAVTAALNAAFAASRRMICGYGFLVVAGYNDTLTIAINGVTDTVTMSAGDYQPDALAWHVTQLILAKATFTTKATCGWSEQYNEFTFTAAAGTVQPGFVAPGDVISNGWVTLGWDSWWVQNARAGSFGADPSVGVFIRSPDPRFAETYYLGIAKCNIADTLNVKWLTGANAASNCATELGFDDIDVGGTVQTPPWWPSWGYRGADGWAQHSRGMREAVAALSQTLYGPKSDQVLVAEWIRDESSATQLRNRVFDFGSAPRVWVKFRTHRAPDMQRMRVVGFTNDMDARRPFVKYGSDGSWAGKSFRVIEVEQDLGPSYHQEIMAIEA